MGLDVERDVLTVRAERLDVDQSREMVTAERPRGAFSREMFLGENLETDKIEANYDDGVCGYDPGGRKSEAAVSRSATTTSAPRSTPNSVDPRATGTTSGPRSGTGACFCRSSRDD